MEPRVVISIPNWDGKNITKKCLISVQQRTEYDNYEIVVVDNGSNDGSVPMLKEEFPNIKVIQNGENLGYSKANNQVLNYAQDQNADYTLLLSNDTKIVQSDWLQALVDIAENDPNIGIVGCTIHDEDGNVAHQGRYFPIHSPTLGGRYNYNKHQENCGPNNQYRYIDEVIGAVFLIKEELRDEIGHLDEAYTPAFWEDTDYCVRAWNAGFKVVTTNKVTVEHIGGSSSAKLDKTYRLALVLRNTIRFKLVNYPIDWVILAIPYLMSRTLALFIERSSSGSFRLRSAVRREPINVLRLSMWALISVICDLPTIFRQRKSRANVRDLLK